MPGLVDPMGDAWMVERPPRIEAPRVILPVPPGGEKGPTPGQARGPRWRRTSRNLYVPADAAFDQPAQRIVEAAGHLPRGGAVTGWASLHLAGARYFEGTDSRGASLPVPLCFGRERHRRPRDGARVDRRRLDADEVEVRCGVPCTVVHRAMRDEIRSREALVPAMCVVEMACYAELTSLARFRAYVLERTTGLERTRLLSVLESCVDGAESPQEVWLRTVWVGPAGLPPPRVNCNVYDQHGRFLARPDLLDETDGFVGEYDGPHHRETETRRNDLGREDRLRRNGLEYFSVVGGEKDETDVVARIHDTRARARASTLPSTWTLVPRPGVREFSLDERIDLRIRHGLPLAGPGFAAPGRVT